MSVTILGGIVLAMLLGVLALLAIVWRKLTAGGVDAGALAARIEGVERAQERGERGLREEIARGRENASREAREFRAEIQRSLSTFTADLRGEIVSMSQAQRGQLEVFGLQTGEFHRGLTEKLDAVRDGLDARLHAFRVEIADALGRMTEMTGQRLQALQAENASKLEQIRHTVDEQLQTALEKRLGESFRMVSDRLEQVHRGLGEMQTLASGVGDLKKLLTNVRTRGTWGEAQLGMLLEQMLTAEQYALNVACTGTSERVEFAIKLPGPDREGYIWLPIDAKFPREDYERLLDAVEHADGAAIEVCSRELEIRARQCARDIAQKYIAPPATTEFAIMYLPTEGLYAEVLRRPGLIEAMQREHHVTIAGPMTLAAILNSLQMGFRTLAIQKRSSEVWEVLGHVKTEFEKYGDVLAKVQKKLQEASNTVDAGLTRTRAIHRRLRGVGDDLPLLDEAELEEVVGLGREYPGA